MLFSHRTLIAIAGTFWLIIGLALLSVGLRLIVGVAKAHEALETAYLLPTLTSYVGRIEVAAVCLIAICLFIGYLKGRFVLVKSIKRVVARVHTLPNPASLVRLYHMGYYLLVAAMVGMGVLFRVLSVPEDVRGAIDVAIGAALINGSLIYYRFAAKLKSEDVSAQ